MIVCATNWIEIDENGGNRKRGTGSISNSLLFLLLRQSINDATINQSPSIFDLIFAHNTRSSTDVWLNSSRNWIAVRPNVVVPSPLMQSVSGRDMGHDTHTYYLMVAS